MSSHHPGSDSIFQHLREFRLVLLRLHKSLLDSEKIGYEQLHGRIQTTGEYFRLVVEDEWFSWLRPMSQFIVQIDDVINAKEPVDVSEAVRLLTEAQLMLQPNETGTVFEQRYFTAIQRDPTIALAHAEMTQILGQTRS